MCFGLAACGGSGSSGSASSSAASSSAESSETVFWKGELSDGSTVCYVDDVVKGEASLLVVKSDFSDAAFWSGPCGYSADGKITITDSETQKTISYTITDITPTSFKVNIEGYGEVELKAVTEADIKAFGEELAATVKSEGEKFLKEIEETGTALKKEVEDRLGAISNELDKAATEFANLDDNTVLFWNGTFADGKDAIYMDDPESGEAFLAIVKEDLSGGEVWYGKYSAGQDGKILTITDSDNGKTVTYELAETTPGKAMKMTVKGLGEVDLASVTKGDFTKLAEELAKSADEGAAK